MHVNYAGIAFKALPAEPSAGGHLYQTSASVVAAGINALAWRIVTIHGYTSSKVYNIPTVAEFGVNTAGVRVNRENKSFWYQASTRLTHSTVGMSLFRA
jgi:hypothetical protein